MSWPLTKLSEVRTLSNYQSRSCSCLDSLPPSPAPTMLHSNWLQSGAPTQRGVHVALWCSSNASVELMWPNKVCVGSLAAVHLSFKSLRRKALDRRLFSEDYVTSFSWHEWLLVPLTKLGVTSNNHTLNPAPHTSWRGPQVLTMAHGQLPCRTSTLPRQHRWQFGWKMTSEK